MINLAREFAIIAGLGGALLLQCGCLHTAPSEASPTLDSGENGAYHVYPDDSIQDALDAAAKDSQIKTVVVHAGVYRPDRPGQALIWFNARHDGITLQAEGEVVLTAANPEIADRSSISFPAVVNHVVFFGDGVSDKTVLRGFKITGANSFVTTSEERPIEPDALLPPLVKGEFFYTDGGGIKVYARSYPRIENVEIFDNYASPCGGGVSIEHRGFVQESVVLKDCVFRNNRCQVTGAAVDLLHGSAATIENCLFVGNISNMGEDFIGQRDGTEYNPEHGSGALTVFPGSKVVVRNCTFTGNWNGVDDKGVDNAYINSIFWQNTSTGGICPGERYELDIIDGSRVEGCMIAGNILDLRNSLDSAKNIFNAPPPRFDDDLIPLAPQYDGVGYRPVKSL